MAGTDPEDKRNKSGLSPVDYGESYEKYLDKRPKESQANYYNTQGRQVQDPYAMQSASQQAQQAPAQMEEPVRAGPTGFVGFGQQLGANVESAERMAQQMGKAALESGQVGMLGASSGQAALLQRALGKAAEVSPLDAALAGAAGGDYLGQLQASYGPEAQARRAADMASAREQAARTQEQMSNAPAKKQARLNATASEAARLRKIDAKRPFGQLTVEQWANNHGMTLEQWIAGGKRPAF